MPVSEISVRGGTFRVRCWSEGSGSPLLYLHGVDGWAHDVPFLRRLAERHRVIAPEHPGFGESAGIEAIDEMLDMTLYYRQFIEQEVGAPVDLVGHSLGGMFAAEIAAICPQLVRRLVLVSPFGLWLEEQQIPDFFVMSPAQLQRHTWHEPEGAAAQQAMSQMGDGQSGPVAVVTRSSNLGTAGKFLWPIPDRGLARRLPLITAPALIISGESDRLVGPAYGEAFARAIPGARHEIIAAAGHSPMLEQEDAFVRQVEDFLA